MIKTESNYSKFSYGIQYEKLKYHALHHAIYDSRIAQIRILLKIQPELINLRTGLGLTPLMIACLLPESERKINIIKQLIKAPCLNPYLNDHCKRSVIFYFVHNSNIIELKEFLDVSKFNYYSQTDIDGHNIMHYAAIRENMEILEFVINLFLLHSINIEITNNMKYTPLLLACKLCKYRSIWLIIKMGGKDFNCRDNEFFRNCLEWLEHKTDNNNNNNDQKSIKDNQLFYFDTFQVEHDVRSNYSSRGTESNSVECKTFSARNQNNRNTISGQENLFRNLTARRSHTIFISKLSLDNNIESKSFMVTEVENMSLETVKESVMLSLKNTKRKINGGKKVSIVINDKVYLPKTNLISVNNLQVNRETSASIAHRLLDQMAHYYYF